MNKKVKKFVTLVLTMATFTAVSSFSGNCNVVVAAEESIVTELDSAPNASVRYHYSPTVACGSIRYISQMARNDYFYSNYWGGWTSCAGSECYTSCISMALSYIGINVTPNEILNCGNGVTRPQLNWGGATFSTDSVKNAISNYIEGNGKYSPPIIHLNSYSGYGHYVVLAGQVSENVYQVLDPAVSSVWNITINGNSATYTVNGRTYSDTVTCAYQYYNSEASILDTSEEAVLDLTQNTEPEAFTTDDSLNLNLLNIQIDE